MKRRGAARGRVRMTIHRIAQLARSALFVRVVMSLPRLAGSEFKDGGGSNGRDEFSGSIPAHRPHFNDEEEANMMLGKFIEGLEILRGYYKDPDGCHIGAEHDQFFVYATDKPLSEEDVKKMQELGWFQPESDNNGDTPPPYDPED